MQTEYEVIMTDECDNEMDRICGYIRDDLYANIACNALLEEVIEVIGRLEILPFAYPKVERYKALDKEYRKVVIKNYVIIYDVDEKEHKVYLDHMFYAKSNYINKI